jgi:hypothetical protein
MIQTSITERYPDHSFFGEETYSKDKQMSIGDGFTWIVDPIDVSDNLDTDTCHCGSLQYHSDDTGNHEVRRDVQCPLLLVGLS